MDGFRALAYVGKGETRLVSKNGRPMKCSANLATSIHLELNCEAVFDGEIVVLDSDGRPRFYDLLRGRASQYSMSLMRSGSMVRTCGPGRCWNESVFCTPSFRNNHRSCCTRITLSRET
jgi:ATP-dependent DNA ligase